MQVSKSSSSSNMGKGQVVDPRKTLGNTTTPAISDIPAAAPERPSHTLADPMVTANPKHFKASTLPTGDTPPIPTVPVSQRSPPPGRDASRKGLVGKSQFFCES